MSVVSDDYVAIWYEHICGLAGHIGPRGSTTEQERQGAEYCRGVLDGLELAPQVETFTSARSGYQIHVLVAVSMLVSFAIYPLGGAISAIAAALIAAVALYSEIMELLFHNNPLRRLIAKGSSQNVVARVPAQAEHRQDLILIGHIDTNRTPLIFKSVGWVDAWRVATPIIFFSFCAQVVLYAVGAATHWGWIWPASAESAVCAVVLAAVCLQAELTPYTPGANDNASGAGMVLTLARALVDQPLRHTRVWLVNTGCEEVKHYGAIDFLTRHRAEMRDPRALVFEMLGRDGPAWLEREVIIPLFGYRASPQMVALVERLADEHPEWQAHATKVTGGHTEMADALRVGIPAITLIGIGPDGTGFGYSGPELYWHRTDDTPDKMKREVMARAYALTWAFMCEMDAAAASG